MADTRQLLEYANCSFVGLVNKILELEDEKRELKVVIKDLKDEVEEQMYL